MADLELNMTIVTFSSKWCSLLAIASIYESRHNKEQLINSLKAALRYDTVPPFIRDKFY